MLRGGGKHGIHCFSRQNNRLAGEYFCHHINAEANNGETKAPAEQGGNGKSLAFLNRAPGYI